MLDYCMPESQPEEGEEGQWLSASEILLNIQIQSGMHISRTRMTTFGRILQKNGIIKTYYKRKCMVRNKSINEAYSEEMNPAVTAGFIV